MIALVTSIHLLSLNSTDAVIDLGGHVVMWHNIKLHATHIAGMIQCA